MYTTNFIISYAKVYDNIFKIESFYQGKCDLDLLFNITIFKNEYVYSEYS